MLLVLTVYMLRTGGALGRSLVSRPHFVPHHTELAALKPAGKASGATAPGLNGEGRFKVA